MDSLHFYIFHCFDVGLRIKTTELKKEEKKEENKDKYFDNEFNKINNIISQRKNITKTFARFSITKNNKFNIKTINEEINELNDNNNNTYLDELYLYLIQNKNISKHDIEQLVAFTTNEEYETDSIEYDAGIHNGNIAL
eukprot:452073_1